MAVLSLEIPLRLSRTPFGNSTSSRSPELVAFTESSFPPIIITASPGRGSGEFPSSVVIPSVIGFGGDVVVVVVVVVDVVVEVDVDVEVD